ncbi:MAG: phosphatidate cytidylyltransferase [Verrucomicrobia bacterium]|nr:phosphatidate cytidylyltransferase [Verrucomicrobiota bacterium]
MPEEQQSVPAPPSKHGVLMRRLGSSVLLWTLVIGTLFSSNKLISDYLFLVTMMAIAGIGLAEFYELVGRRQLACFKGLGVFGGLLLMTSTFVYLSDAFPLHLHPAKANDFETSVLIVFVLGLCLRQLVSRTNSAGITAIATTLFGLMYVPWLLNFIQKIKFFPNINAPHYVLYFILVTKFSDLGAYVVGSLIGKHKMCPRISPGKTWEGFAGAIVISTLASVLLVQAAQAKLPHMDLGHAIILGVALGGAAVVGDLIESLFKREAGVKDSGRLFPGIGGMLDLMDSLLFNAPLMYVYLRHVLTA